MNTSFIQIVDGSRYAVSIPAHRVETVINRADKWLEREAISIQL